jgi:dsRNA-specific ribonuclease
MACELEIVTRHALGKDAKSRLQEWTQKEYGVAPRYRVVDSDGPDHAKTFVIDVAVLGQRCGVGSGASKQEASQAAATQALVALGQEYISEATVSSDIMARWPVAEDVLEEMQQSSEAVD